MEKNVPGYAGWTITGDRSVEFAKCPLDFIEKRLNQHASKIFLSRALNKPTVFVCSNKGVKEILHDNEKSFNMGYKDFGYIHQLYGDLLLFYDGAEAMRVRSIIGKLFDPRSGHNCSTIMSRIEDDFLSSLNEPSSVPLYETFKSLTTALGLKLFLNLDWKDSKVEFETIKSISIMHWHGLISVPLNIKIRGWSSSYSKAMEAKEYLLDVIRSKLYHEEDSNCKSFMDYAREAGFKNEDETIQHLLLFISALIPKALASMMTSFCIALSGVEKKAFRRRALENENFLDDVLLEVQRLWPPFLGGRRMTTEDVIIDGYKIPADTAVAFMTWFANRDPEVFNNPNEFLPERWQECNEAKRKLVWTFGGGKRTCIGIDFIRMILVTICRKLLLDYDWTLVDAKDISYKTLPVARPRQTGGYKPICDAPSNVVKRSTQVSSTPAEFTNRCSPSSIIMEPSRELAVQTNENVKLFKKYIPDPRPSCCVLVGGGDTREMSRELENGVDIVTGTPGKLIDFISTGKLKLDQVRFFILDEVDGLLAQNQRDTIEQIYRKCPKFSSDGKRLQMIVCSATLHNFEVKKLAEKLMHFPTWIDLKGQDSVPDTVHHVVCRVDPSKDMRWRNLRQPVKTDGIHEEDSLNPNKLTPEMKSEAIKLLKAEYLLQAIIHHKMDQAIIFCRTKLDCDNMEKYLMAKAKGLKGFNISCVCLHSDRSHKERQGNLAAFKSGKAKFLICTDVAARGIDVKGIPFVINVTLPDDKANYIHRIGRVGRAERMGLAISLAGAEKEKVWYHKCDSRGRGCYNSDLIDRGGCAIWYNEMQYLADIEEHLGETINTVEADFKIPVNEFDGKVVYGEKRSNRGGNFSYHTAELASSVRELAALEKKAQASFLQFKLDWQKAAA